MLMLNKLEYSIVIYNLQQKYKQVVVYLNRNRLAVHCILQFPHEKLVMSHPSQRHTKSGYVPVEKTENLPYIL